MGFLQDIGNHIYLYLNNQKYKYTYQESFANILEDVRDVCDFCTWVLAQEMLIHVAVQIRAQDEFPACMNYDTMHSTFKTLKYLRNLVKKEESLIETMLKDVAKLKSEFPFWEDIRKQSKHWKNIENFPERLQRVLKDQARNIFDP